MNKKKSSNPNPRLFANLFDKICFWWLKPFFCYAKSHDLKNEDLYDTLPEDRSGPLGDKLEKFWNHEIDNWVKLKKKPSLVRALRKAFGWSYYRLAGHYTFYLVVMRPLLPTILFYLIYHFDSCSTTTTLEAYGLATGVVVGTVVQSVVARHAIWGSRELGMRLRIACSSLIYRKLTRLSGGSQDVKGRIISLLGNDVSRFDELFVNLHTMWAMPLQGAIITYFLWRNLGAATIVGLFFLILQSVPMQTFFVRLLARLRKKVASKTDTRIALISEILNGIRIIKMNTWEKPFERLVKEARRFEVRALTSASYILGMNVATALFSERVSLFCTLAFYVFLGNRVTAQVVFSTYMYFITLQTTLYYAYSRGAEDFAEAKAAVSRIEKFLTLEEVNPTILQYNKDSNSSISIVNVETGWSDDVQVLQNVNICVPQKKFYAVVGSTSSGKSSLLNLILGELRAKKGHVSVNGTVSYSSQEAWLFPDSIRSNILFGQPYEEDKYNKVVKVCSLKRDFAQLSRGDKTLVGDRGTNLSGGQCARVNFARAVYRESDIYLFDDSLSAVDTQVGKAIFEECILGYLKDKTRILVTHQLQYLKQADVIVVLNAGRVEFQGSFSEFCAEDRYLHYVNSEEKSENEVEIAESRSDSKVSLASVSKVEAEQEEEAQETNELIAKGRISRFLYWKYFKSAESSVMLIIISALLILSQLSWSGLDYWLGFWTRQEEARFKDYLNDLNASSCFAEQLYNFSSSNSSSLDVFDKPAYLDTTTSLFIYGLLTLSNIVFITISNLLYFKICMRSVENIHNTMFARILRAPVQFFDKNSSGYILNRFSKDIDIADSRLPKITIEAFRPISMLIGIVIQVLIIDWWMIFALIIIGYFCLKLCKNYLNAVRDINRLEGANKSPVLLHANSALAGLPTIRACHAQNTVCRDFDTKQDLHTATYSLILSTAAAFNIWLDFLMSVFIVLVTFGFVLLDSQAIFDSESNEPGVNKPAAGTVALGISQSLALYNVMQLGAMQIAFMFLQMTSLERLFDFTKLDQETQPENETLKKPDQKWPEKGRVEFKQIYLRYAENEEPVLKDLNFIVEAGMKVGIVGRTGAGKSSLIAALFRLAKIDGSILIDEVDTKKIDLKDLRKKISIIPQEAMLFSTSLRDNLDPTGEHDDTILWSALELLELKEKFNSLEIIIKNGGVDFSAGQRQLLCLARAIIENNKIIILDEATANVDPVAESLIQKVIKTSFKHCTVLTIAHRLNTIMDSDKVLVMEGGEVVEYDRPHILLQNNDGYLTQMVQKTDNATVMYLKSIAEQAFVENSKTDNQNSQLSTGN